MEKKLVWIIFGNGYNLEDGTLITYDYNLDLKTTHEDCCKDFCEKHGIDCTFCHSHTDFAKLFTALGFIVVLNSAKKIDGKYFCSIFLPEKMTEKQISFLEEQKSFFVEKYDTNKALFKTKVFTTTEHPYKTKDSFRDLYIESIIENNQTENGQELLYREVERQKENLEINNNQKR